MLRYNERHTLKEIRDLPLLYLFSFQIAPFGDLKLNSAV